MKCINLRVEMCKRQLSVARDGPGRLRHDYVVRVYCQGRFADPLFLYAFPANQVTNNFVIQSVHRFVCLHDTYFPVYVEV